jgi:hypothetical protein
MITEEFTDWRGSPVRPGDVVLYPSMSGRSCQMTEGVFIEAWKVYYNCSKWQRLAPGETPPTKKSDERLRDEAGDLVWEGEGPDRRVVWHEVELPAKTEWRIRIQPTRDSRFTRYSGTGDWNPEKHDYERIAPAKPVTLTLPNNVTFFSRPEAPDGQ